MIAEELLGDLTSEESVEGAKSQEQMQGGNDLSRVAGRAKWALDRLLGVQLPDVHPGSSPQDLAKLHAEASRLVEGYRSGIMAGVADHPISPREFADLKGRYRGKIVDPPPGQTLDPVEAMEDLLGEWSPIGRKMEDLVSILGARSGYGTRRASGEALYRISDMWGNRVDLYYFHVTNGIIRSVRRSPHN